MNAHIRHVDAFTGHTFRATVATVPAMLASNDTGGPFDDAITSVATRDRAIAAALATLDVLTPANFAAYAALMSA